MKLTWQPENMFQWAGLYLTAWGKRYRILKVGPR